jgi:chromosome partitioning protein
MNATSITAITNQKGGVGKTATTINVGAALAEAGHNVLLIDLDPQGHLTDGLKLDQAPASDGSLNLFRALIGDYTGSIADLIASHSAPSGRLDVIPNTIEMFMSVRELDKVRAREHRLARLLAAVRGVYDHVLIDAPPSLDILTDNALTAADGVLIPVQAEDSSLKALGLLLPQIASVDADLRDKPLELHGLVVSPLRRPTTKLAESVLTELAELDGLPILGTVPLGVVVTEAWRYGRTVLDYSPDSEHAQTYRTIAKALPGGAAEPRQAAPTARSEQRPHCPSAGPSRQHRRRPGLRTGRTARRHSWSRTAARTGRQGPGHGPPVLVHAEGVRRRPRSSRGRAALRHPTAQARPPSRPRRCRPGASRRRGTAGQGRVVAPLAHVRHLPCHRAIRPRSNVLYGQRGVPRPGEPRPPSLRLLR